MKKIFLVLFIFVLLLPGCSSDILEDNGLETFTAESTELQTDDSAAKTIDEEIKFYPTYDENYKTGHNLLFGFWFDIPVDWNAVDRTEDGSAYSIICGNDKADIKIYGELISDENADENRFYAKFAGNSGSVSEFIFRDGWVGKQIKVSNTEEYYLRIDGDSYLIVHIDVSKDPQWKEQNKDTLLNFALSARTTQESYGKNDILENTITPKELQLGSITVGMTYDELLDIVGQKLEDEVVEEYEGLVTRTLFFADGTQVYIADDMVYTINVISPEYETPKGLKTGDSVERLQELYGEPTIKKDGIWGYHYKGFEIFTVVFEEDIVTQIQIDYGALETEIY